MADMTAPTQPEYMKSDITILGGGPGGYVAAIRASQLGETVILVEKDKIGGTCTNRGCIPSKSLLRIEEIMMEIRQSPRFGLRTGYVTVDFKTIMHKANQIATGLSKNVSNLLIKNQVKILRGYGRLIQPNLIKVDRKEGNIEVESKNVVIATGASPHLPPIPGINERNVWNSDNFWNLSHLPESVVIVGGGPIGLEFATILKGLGSEVTVLEMMPHIIPKEDQEIADYLQKTLEKKGIRIITGAKVLGIKETNRVKEVSVSIKGEEVDFKGRIVIIATGRMANSSNLGLEEAGIKTDENRIIVDERMQTSIPHHYAVGDVVGRWMLAHVAMQEGIVAAENSAGVNSKMDYNAVPRCIYSRPEAAFAGLSEEECKRRNLTFGKALYPLSANGRAATMRELNGVIKIIYGKEYGEILGVHVVSPEASELIHQAVLAISLEATVEDLGSMIYAHPTISEIVREASLKALGKAVHI